MKHQADSLQRPHRKGLHLALESCITRTGDGAKSNARLLENLPSNSHPTKETTISAIAVIKNELKLTQRQSEVLYWMAEGKSNEEISIILECSFFTVKSHAKAIFRLLRVETRTAAAGFAHRAYAKIAK